MAKIKKGDFIELEYTGRIKDTNEVFDTTDKKLALELGIAVKNMAYGPVIICVGENFTLAGIEEQIIGKEPGKYELDLVDIFKGKPLVYKLDEGKYIIDVASTFQAKELDIPKDEEIPEQDYYNNESFKKEDTNQTNKKEQN